MAEQRFAADAARQIGRAIAGVVASAGSYARDHGFGGWGGGQRAFIDGPYRGASYADAALRNWHARNGEVNAEMKWDRPTLTARARDLERNDGWALAALDRQVDALAGSGFRLSAQPDGAALGWDPAVTAEFARACEQEWRRYAEGPTFNCDLRRASTFSQLSALNFLHRLRDGECLAAAPWRPGLAGPGGYATRFAVFDPDRLSTPQDRQDGPYLRQGVELDVDGGPIGYHLQNAHPAEAQVAKSWTYWPRFDEFGLPVVMHDFSIRRSGQARGITAFAPLLRSFRQLGRFADAEVDTAIVQALIAMTIETMETPSEIADRLGKEPAANEEETRAQFYAQRSVRAGEVTAVPLRPGDKLNVQTAARSGANYLNFEGSIIGRIAAGLGMSREELSKDWSKTNYSSARAGMLQTKQFIRARRSDYVARVVQPFYFVWLAEAIDRGRIKPPLASKYSFEAAPEAYARANWITPGLGWVDPVKEAEGAKMRMANGMSNLRDECADDGKDWEENAEQLEREIAWYKQRGMVHPAEAPPTPMVVAPEREETPPAGAQP